MVTLAIVAANFIVDLLYVLLDPRTRQGREA
jgi:ABC-type dipeptide/oligopeptide/nickel transport system permease component